MSAAADNDSAVVKTLLDRAFMRSQEDPDQTPQFFETLFAAMLFLPVSDDFDTLDAQSQAEDREVTPVFYEVDGDPTVVVFDTEERLAKFVDEPTNYIGVQGRDLFRMFDGQEQIGLNLSVAPSSVLIPPENVAWLHEQAVAAVAVHEVEPGASLRLEHPGDVAPASIAALTSCLAGLRDAVEEAVLVRISVDDPAEADQARLVLAMVPTLMGVARAEEVAQSVAQAAAPLAAGAEPVEVSVFHGESALMSKARAVGLTLPIRDIGSMN